MIYSFSFSWKRYPLFPFKVFNHGRVVPPLGPSQAGGRLGSLRDATPVPAQTPTQAARSCAHTATVSGDVPREVRASETAVSAASSMGEPRGAYLGQPSAAPRPAPEEPPRTCRDRKSVV